MPVIISADVVYRLCPLDTPRIDDCGFLTESDDEVHAHIHARLVRDLQQFFAQMDFLRVLTDIEDLQEEFLLTIEQEFLQDGIEIDFAFRTFADTAGFLDVLRKVHEVEEMAVEQGIEVLEEALNDALAFSDSNISEFVRVKYVSFLEHHGEAGKAAEVRNRELQ